MPSHHAADASALRPVLQTHDIKTNLDEARLNPKKAAEIFESRVLSKYGALLLSICATDPANFHPYAPAQIPFGFP